MADREDAGAHDLGDEARGVVGEREPQGEELGLQRHAAPEIESLERRHLPGQGRSCREERHPGRTNDESGADPEDRVDLPRLVLHPLRPPAKHDRGDDGDDEHRADDTGTVLQHRRGHVEAAVGEKHRVPDVDRLARRRQGGHHDPVDEQDVQQYRDVAGELDEYVDHAADQPVAGQPQDAHGEAEHGREHDAADRDQQGVQDSDRRRDQVGFAGVVVDEGGEGDVVGGGGGQEVEAEFLADRFEIDGHVVQSDCHQGAHHRHGEDLHDDRPCLLVPPEANDRAGRFDGSDCRHRWLPGEGAPACASTPARVSDSGQARFMLNGTAASTAGLRWSRAR